jgi:hypothetical protein
LTKVAELAGEYLARYPEGSQIDLVRRRLDEARRRLDAPLPGDAPPDSLSGGM